MYTQQNILFSDDDLPGAHLLAEAKFSLQKIFPQMQKKFQISLERPNLRVRKTNNKTWVKTLQHSSLFHFKIMRKSRKYKSALIW